MRGALSSGRCFAISATVAAFGLARCHKKGRLTERVREPVRSRKSREEGWSKFGCRLILHVAVLVLLVLAFARLFSGCEMPSIWPLALSSSSLSATANSENLMLEELALTTAIASAISGDRFGAHFPARPRHQCGYRTGCETGHDRVGAAGENDRHAGAEDDAGRI